MILYEFKKTRSYKCRWLIKELGATCEYREVDLSKGEHNTLEYLQINPFGKVPSLVDGKLKIHEANAICYYLADLFPEKNLIPKPYTHDRAHFNKWAFFMSNEIECYLWSIEKNTWIYPEDKRSSSSIEMSKQDARNALGLMTKELSGKEYLLNNSFSVLDIMAGYLLRWARSHKLLEGNQVLLDYLDRLIARETYPHEIFA